MAVVALVFVAGEALTAPELKPLCWSSDQVQCRVPQESAVSGVHAFCDGLSVLIHCLLLVISVLELFIHFSPKCKWYLLILLHPHILFC